VPASPTSTVIGPTAVTRFRGRLEQDRISHSNASLSYNAEPGTEIRAAFADEGLQHPWVLTDTFLSSAHHRATHDGHDNAPLSFSGPHACSSPFPFEELGPGLVPAIDEDVRPKPLEWKIGIRKQAGKRGERSAREQMKLETVEISSRRRHEGKQFPRNTAQIRQRVSCLQTERETHRTLEIADRTGAAIVIAVLGRAPAAQRHACFQEARQK